MKILHVGSFRGNIGDNANHAGFRPWFESIVKGPITWREFEIRNVYRKIAAFDGSFVETANECDLLVIGGGNYFELWVDRSPTGTSVSIAPEDFENLKVPVFFNALGVDEGQGASAQNLDKFKSFLRRLLDSPHCLVSVRNDGAYPALHKHFRDLPLHKVLRLPDGGFFAGYSRGCCTKRRRPDQPRIGINLAGDMLALRFPNVANLHSYQSFLEEFSDVLTETATRWPGALFVFYPHIFSDLKVYADLLETLPDAVRRERVEVATYGCGVDAAKVAFSDYANCDLILGMRFHANVVPIGELVPTVGLCCYSQIRNLYAELGMPHHCIEVSTKGFAPKLRAQVTDMIEDGSAARAELSAINVRLGESRATAARRIVEWLTAQAVTQAGQAK